MLSETRFLDYSFFPTRQGDDCNNSIKRQGGVCNSSPERQGGVRVRSTSRHVLSSFLYTVKYSTGKYECFHRTLGGNWGDFWTPKHPQEVTKFTC